MIYCGFFDKCLWNCAKHLIKCDAWKLAEYWYPVHVSRAPCICILYNMYICTSFCLSVCMFQYMHICILPFHEGSNLLTSFTFSRPVKCYLVVCMIYSYALLPLNRVYRLNIYILSIYVCTNYKLYHSQQLWSVAIHGELCRDECIHELYRIVWFELNIEYLP